MNKQFYEIKRIAKQKLSGHFGTALFVSIIPPLIYGIIGAVVGFFFSVFSREFGDLVNTVITGYGTFISISLILSLFKGKTNFTSEHFFFYDDRVLQYFLLSIILFFLGFTVFIPFYGQIQSITELPALIFNDQDYLSSLIESLTIFQALGSLLATIITIYIGVRFLFSPYIIIDQHLPVIEALKKSWTYTRGKFWYLFFFPLSFILWYLLVIPTFFLILLYLIPYIALSYAALYVEFKKAYGDEETIIEEPEDFVEVDILDDDIYK